MSTNIGVWGWGSVATVLGIAAILFIAIGNDYVIHRIDKGGNVLGAIIAAAILAWAYFYQQSNSQAADTKLDDLKAEVAKLTAEVRRLAQQGSNNKGE